MALWQIVDAKGGTLQSPWDDGATEQPGDPGFSTDAVATYAGAKNFNYMGTPNWTPPVDQSA